MNTAHLQLPAQIALPAVGEVWQLAYLPTAAASVTLRHAGNGTLRISGAIHQHALCHTALQRWLQRHAKAHLGEWLQRLAADTGLRYTGCCVKGQRSRWGSCSSRGNINLNYKLMLLPPEWVRYVLIHELCHTVEMNHSKRFWAQVTRFEPGYKAIHAQMRGVMGRLPGWVL